MSLAACLVLAAVPAGQLEIDWDAPNFFIEGQPFRVSMELTAVEDGTSYAAWLTTPSAFSIDGEPLEPRVLDVVIPLAKGDTIRAELDLAPHIDAAGAFRLSYAQGVTDGGPIAVSAYRLAQEETSFMELPVERLGSYHALLRTNSGDIMLEMWPDVAPNHVKSFLDFCHTGFYDGVIFHRVIEGFMIQGGDKSGTGFGSAPRKLDAEFSDRKHVPGVLSMARLGNDVNSAGSQFFIMHAANPSLDGQYSAFGKVVWGMDTVDRIARTPKQGKQGKAAETPVQRQVIEKALVLLPIRS